MRNCTLSLLVAASLVVVAVPARAQLSGHNLRGDFGLRSGSQPDPGFYLSSMFLAYSADTLRNRNGDSIGIDPERRGGLDARAYAVVLSYVTDFTLLGAHVGFMAAPSLTNNNLEIPILESQSRTDTAFADLYVQPFVLGWHTARADVTAGLGFFAPTGKYEPGGQDNVGLGMWSYEVFAGTTLYFDEKKSWSLATTAFYETHGKKEDSDVRVGDILTLEGGLGIASVVNLRDLGGYQTTGGVTVVRGVVYRSNQLSGISESDMERLGGLGLKVDCDLRTAAEREKRPDELPPGVENVWLNVLADSPEEGPAHLEDLMKDPEAANAALGGGKVAAAFEEGYREFVSLPSAKAEFRNLFLGLGDRDRLPALFHCTTGKDRTGWGAAALLTLLGAPRDVVMEDFLRSNDYIIPAYQEVIDGFVAAGGEEKIPLSALGVKKEYLEAAFDEMETKHGTMENYFSEALGIDSAQQGALRDLYLSQEWTSLPDARREDGTSVFSAGDQDFRKRREA